MVVRAEFAYRRPPARTGGPTAAYLDHIGFTLISLADGFAVVAAIRGGAPGWAVGVLAVGVVVVGHLTLQAASAGWSTRRRPRRCRPSDQRFRAQDGDASACGGAGLPDLDALPERHPVGDLLGGVLRLR